MPTADELIAAAQRQALAGKLTEAETDCHQLLKDWPEHVDALTLLARIQCQHGDFSAAIQSISRAISAAPEQARLHAFHGDVSCSAGNVNQAIECYRRTLELDPLDAETWNNLGVLLKRLQRRREAIDCFREALRLKPELPLPHKNLAELCISQQDWDEALLHFRQAVHLAPKDVEVHCGIGRLLAQLGQYAAATDYLAKALTLSPGNSEAQQQLSAIANEIATVEQKAEVDLTATPLRKDLAKAHVNLGKVCMEQGRVEEIVDHSRVALRLDPHNVAAHNNMGMALTDLGKFAAAVSFLNNALRLDPNYVPAYFNLRALAMEDRYHFSDAQLQRIETLAEDESTTRKDTCLLLFLLGDVFDSAGEYSKAFQYYERANDTRQRMLVDEGVAFNVRQFRRMIDMTIEVFDRKFFRRVSAWGSESEIPVFVVGMPRSGTTLVEQIIASHPEALGAGELLEIGKLADGISARSPNGHPYPMAMKVVDQQAIRWAAQKYLDCLATRGLDASRIVDKLPANLFHLGMIYAMFPQSHVIHCQRDALDVGRSCYFNFFNSLSWVWRQEDIGLYFHETERLTAHWRDVFPKEIHEVAYEQLTSEPDTVCRRLIAFCGLQWSDNCLEFYKRGGPVQSASRVQVRQPLYKKSIGRWKRYESQLAPLRNAIQSR